MGRARKLRRRAAKLAVLLWAVLSWTQTAFALNPALDISQYVHTAWKIRDGFSKGRVVAFAQTADGYLWLGTEFGLLRFDGVRFVPWGPPAGASLPAEYIRSLLGSRDGTLWIGTSGGLVGWKSGALTPYPQFAGMSVDSLLEDQQGTVWAIGNQTNRLPILCAIRNGNPECHDNDGMLGTFVSSLVEDGKGNVWGAASRKGVWRWTPGESQFYALTDPPGGSLQVLAHGGDGLLMVTGTGIGRFADGKALKGPLGAAQSSFVPATVFRDRDGGVWIGTRGGLLHVHQERTDAFARSDGLSGDSVGRVFEDREGNIWVTTIDGIDRFRESAAALFSVSQGLSTSVVGAVLAAMNGDVWIGTQSGLNRVRDRTLNLYRGPRARLLAGTSTRATQIAGVRAVRESGPPDEVQSLFLDTRGRVWVATAQGTGYVAGDRFVPISGVPRGIVNDIAEDTQGNLWFAYWDRDLLRLAPNHDVQQMTQAQLGVTDIVTRLAADPVRGGLWLGLLRGGVSYYANGRIQNSYTAANGLAPGRVHHVHVDSAGTLWVAAEGGLSRLKNGRFATMSSRNGLPCDAVDWMIDDDMGSLWLSMACGIVRIAGSDLEAWTTAVERNRDAHPTIRAAVFDSADGVRNTFSVSSYGPHVTRSADGRLWFVAPDGVTIVDPRHLSFNNLPPPVHIEQITADRTSYPGESAGRVIQLPALIRDLQIDYTALSLSAPEKVHFRYKLEGRDRAWQNAGTRRQAFYTDLSPGNYRFRVIASNNSGVWNEAGTFVDFSVAPAYYQTAWFMALSVAAVAALAWSAHRVRLRIVEKHQGEISALNARLMKAQEQERIRIAGEIHDGVMQEMLAVTMMLGRAKRRIPAGSDATATIDGVQQKLIQVGTDLRQLSHDLHPPLLQEAGLPRAINAYCEQFTAACGIPVACEAADDVRDLSRGAALALFRIVQEALGNAAKHAAAKRISVRLFRSDGNVSLIVRDDGVGLDPNRFASGGGLGLVMMRERASQLNGRFDFESAPGRGTTIRVTIPFR